MAGARGGGGGARFAGPDAVLGDRGMEPTRSPVAIGGDHAGVAMRAALRRVLEEGGHPVLDLGTDGEASVDYPRYADLVAAAVTDGRARFGVLVCGTGIGVSIAANRHAAIRCALVHDSTGARLAREHNDSNVLALGARVIGEQVAIDALRTFLGTDYAGGRHERRVAMLSPDRTHAP